MVWVQVSCFWLCIVVFVDSTFCLSTDPITRASTSLVTPTSSLLLTSILSLWSKHITKGNDLPHPYDGGRCSRSNDEISSAVRLNDGNRMPLLGLGVFKAPPGNCTENAVYEALRLGYRHIDTAELYDNEEEVGRAIRRYIASHNISRSDLWVTTKFYPRPGLGYDAVMQSLRRSLTRLGLKYVDLYLIHSPNEKLLRLEQWTALVDAKKLGLVRSIGVSNYGIHHLKEMKAVSSVIPAVNQVELNPYIARKELVNYCLRNGILPQAYSPLTKSIKLQDSKLIRIASKYAVTPAQVLIRWCLQKGYSVIPKSIKAHRLGENADVYHFSLSGEDMDALDKFDEHLVTGWDPTVNP